MSALHYPARMVMRARVLREPVEGEPLWSLRETARILHEEFPDYPMPTHPTIIGWTDPQWMERKLATMRAYKAEQRADSTRGRLGRGPHSIQLQEARCRALLNEAGMLGSQVSRVMEFDYPGQGWTRHRVLKFREAVAA